MYIKRFGMDGCKILGRFWMEKLVIYKFYKVANVIFWSNSKPKASFNFPTARLVFPSTTKSNLQICNTNIFQKCYTLKLKCWEFTLHDARSAPKGTHRELTTIKTLIYQFISILPFSNIYKFPTPFNSMTFI